MLPLVTKALHLIFMVTWFAGLFYLPRLYIYHAQASEPADWARFTLMEKRLFSIMTIGAVLTFVFGLWTLASPVFSSAVYRGWFQLKLLALAGMVIHHALCWRWIKRLERGERPTSTRWLRWFNEIPVFYLFAIVLLAVLKPF